MITTNILANVFIHVTGGDNGAGIFYLEESGFIGLVFGCGFIITWYRKHNCHQHYCPWLGKHSVGDGSIIVCRKHHPVLHQHKRILPEHIMSEHLRYKKVMEKQNGSTRL